MAATIRYAPDLTGVPPNIQRELEFLRSNTYKLLDNQQAQASAQTIPQAPVVNRFKQEAYSFVSGQLDYPLRSRPEPNTVDVYVNGTLLRAGTAYDYTLSGQRVFLSTTLVISPGDWIQINYQGAD